MVKSEIKLREKKNTKKAEEKISSRLEEDLDKAEEEVKELGDIIEKESADSDQVQIKASKPIAQLKRGDKIKVDGMELEVDAHYVLMEHGKTKEMAMELFNPKTDKDFQIRYFSDQTETSLEFYELQEIVYVKKKINRIEW